MSIAGNRSQSMQRRARQVMPLGVNSNFRYWGEGMTPYVERAQGAYLWDVDGRRFIDYRMAFGPVILGHAFEEVDRQVIEEIRKGVLFAMTSELEVAVMEKIVEMCPAVELARLACSGTEATMHAVRLARAFTGREVIVKFEGNYHGFQDYTLWSTYAPVGSLGDRRAPVPVPASAGIPAGLRDLVITLPFNDLEGLDQLLRERGEQVAAILTEPCQGNCGAIDPAPGFLEFIRQKCDEYGIVFILDEVKTGFRIANGGAQQYYGIKPDLATYAKALGNGYPIAAFGGRREIMELIGEKVAHGGTYTNNKPGIAAAYATLSLLRERPIILDIQERGRRLMDGLKEIFEDNGIPVAMSGTGSMFSFALGLERVTCQRDWAESNQEYYLRLAEAAMEHGIMPDHDPREPWFLSYSHSEADVAETLGVYADIVKKGS